jgi:uncharacterized protein (DUF362 family)
MNRTKDSQTTSRRDFLKVAGAATVGTGLIAPGSLLAADEAVTKSTVAVVQNTSVSDAVRRAVTLSGGLDFIQPGQRVLIKTCAFNQQAHPCANSPELLYAVIRLVADAGCTDIYVGDRSFFVIKDVMSVLKAVGQYDAAMQAKQDIGGGVNVTVTPLDDAAPYLKEGSEPWRTIVHPQAEHYVDEQGRNTGFQLAEILFQMDHVINLSVAKTHFQAWFTMAMKSFVGMSSGQTRLAFHKFATTNDLGRQRELGQAEIQPDVTPFTNRLVELNLGLEPRLNIIEGTQPMVSGGPVDGDTIKADVVIASRDRIAADVAGIALLRTLGTDKRLQTVSPWQNPMIKYARKIGIGVKYPEHLTLKHEGLRDLEAFRAKMA